MREIKIIKRMPGMIQGYQILEIQRLKNKLHLSKEEFSALIIEKFGANTCLYLSFTQGEDFISYLKERCKTRFLVVINLFPYLKKLLKVI